MTCIIIRLDVRQCYFHGGTKFDVLRCVAVYAIIVKAFKYQLMIIYNYVLPYFIVC